MLVRWTVSPAQAAGSSYSGGYQALGGRYQGSDKKSWKQTFSISQFIQTQKNLEEILDEQHLI